MSERDPLLLSNVRQQVAVVGSYDDAAGVTVERLRRYLRLAMCLAHGDAVAWIQRSTHEEWCELSLGIAPFKRDVTLGPLVDLTSGCVVESAERARTLWPTHPLVIALSDSGAIVACLVRGNQSIWGALCVVSRQSKISESERAAFEDLAELLASEVTSTKPSGILLSELSNASVDVSNLTSDAGEQNWFRNQIVQVISPRLLFVFDREHRVRLVEDTLVSVDEHREFEQQLGLNLSDFLSNIKGSRFVDICSRTLVGEGSVMLWKCFGRHYGLRTVPLRDQTGEIVFGMGLMHEIAGDSTRDGLERLLSAQFRTLVDSLDSGILVEDEQDVILHCNQHFCDLMQIDDLPQTLLGKSSIELVDRISPAFFVPEALAEGIDELKAAKKVVKDELVYLADMRILERSYSPLELDGRGVGHLWTYREVTDRERNKDLLQRQADELRALSLVDELTGLYNRRGFLTLATQQLKLCDRSLRAALIVFVDLDGMKRINDELGHEYGDQALVETASVLRQCFRYSDVVARLGGDEFVVLAVEADPPIAEVVSERLYEKLAEMNMKPERKFELKFSVGIADYDPRKLEMVEEVLARADSLMYEQKRLRKCERKN